MFPNLNMGEDVNFLQRWDFRRRDSDFDSDNSSSSSDGSVLKKHKLVSSFISLDNDTSNASRLEEKQDKSPDNGDQIKVDKAKVPKIRKSKKDTLANNQPTRDFDEEPKVNKGRTSTCEHTAVDGVKSFMESLVEDLKVARENLFKWMREELGSDDADVQPLRTKKRNTTRKRVQPQHPKKSNRSVGTQQRGKKKNVKVDNKNVQVEDQNKIQETVHVQQLNNIGENVGKQDENKSENEMRSQAGSTIFKSSKATHSGNHCQALGDVAAYGKLMSKSLVSVEKEKGKKLASSTYSTFHHANVQAQQQKSIVLGIRAPSYKNEGLGKSVEGIVFADDVDRDQVTGKSKGDHLGLPIEPKFSFNPSCQVASSMYLTLPTILSESSVTSHKPDEFSCDYIQSLVAGHRACVNSERLDHSASYPRYLPVPQREEMIGSFAEMNSRNISLYDQTSCMTTGYPGPLHGVNGGFRIPSQVYTEDLQLENRNKMGQRINGGALVHSGGSYALADQYVAPKLISYPNLKPPTTNGNDSSLFLD
ncbi:uncharacterized protein LOC110812808 isoform X2 [Carica papaya]|nr:uncharacterized protein LOC110812808 isoform X2 [Carica papaya]XP_021895354.1 uncharacterized protein LOC110812808 isoform X2 [Carica papaya]XP_021895355.1 uncharacterized protein LOC110812808 isoform X2 [Carica papaya]